MIDARGRLFGLVNLIDLALVLLLVFAAALGVSAYRLFQIPAPVIERVEPATVAMSQDARVRVVGRNFRHYLKVFTPRSGEPFAVSPSRPEGPEAPIESVTEHALDVRLTGLTPGTYDIYVFDNERQLAHLPAAVTIAPPDVARAAIRTTVRLLLPPEVARQLQVGDRDVVAPEAGGASPEAAQIEKIDVRPDAVDVMDLRIARHVPGDPYLWMGTHSSQVIADIVLRVPVAASASGLWAYKGGTIRAGERFVFETPAATFRGVIVSRGDPETAAP